MPPWLRLTGTCELFTSSSPSLLLWVSPSLLGVWTLGEARRKGANVWLHWCCCRSSVTNKALGSGLFKDSLSLMGSMCGFFRKLWKGHPVPWGRQAIHCDLIQSTFTWRYILQQLAETGFPFLCLPGPWKDHYPLSTTQWRCGFPNAQPSPPTPPTPFLLFPHLFSNRHMGRLISPLHKQTSSLYFRWNSHPLQILPNFVSGSLEVPILQ